MVSSRDNNHLIIDRLGSQPSRVYTRFSVIKITTTLPEGCIGSSMISHTSADDHLPYRTTAGSSTGLRLRYTILL